jgi:oligoribonuclease NrnB/cAMP/cGMP phosphodiesterase (DHH superfamily)
LKIEFHGILIYIQSSNAVFQRINMDSKIRTVVIYHGGCPDGTAAAWALSLALDNNSTYYHYGKFGEESPDVEGKDVIFVDFTYPLEQTRKLLDAAHMVLILDHHKTATQLEVITDPKLTLVIDQTRSGAQLAWDWMYSFTNTVRRDFVPARCGSFSLSEVSEVNKYIDLVDDQLCKEVRPWFIDHIADRDLWNWELPESKDTTRRMFSMGVYDNINNFYSLLDVEEQQIAKEGAILNQDDERMYQKLVKRAVLCNLTTLDGKHTWKVKALECDHSYTSEVGSRLVKDNSCDFAIIYRYNLPTKEWYISCRASKDNDIDLTQIIPLIDPNGGGHPKAAGMAIKSPNTLDTFLTAVARCSTPACDVLDG